MRLRTLAAAAVAIATLGVAAAHAEPGYATADVNMRTGPDIDFPSVAVIPEGEPLYVEGCLRDESWCDVTWGPERGWVYSEYLAFDYRGETVLLPDVGPAYFRIPLITFIAADYWGRYYVGRPWYRDRDRWFAFRRACWMVCPAPWSSPGRLVAFRIRDAVRHAAAGRWLLRLSAGRNVADRRDRRHDREDRRQ
jgi:uncharacterized protein YraI